MRLIVLAVAGALVATSAAAQTPVTRAVQNYLALQNGSKRLADLSPAEIAEVRDLDRELGRRQVVPSDCERQEAAAKTQLDRAVLALKCPPRVE